MLGFPVKMSRHPMLYVSMLMTIVCAHAVMCYPAATCRGYPTIGPFWEVVAPYLMFGAAFLPPLFDDFDDATLIRRVILAVFSVAMILLFSVALTNLGSPRPHIGHLAGYWGVWRYDWGFILWRAFRGLIIAIPFVLCLESVGRGLWSLVRRFDGS